MKITILEPREGFSKEDVNYLKILEESDLFWESVETARAKLGIPVGGFKARYTSSQEKVSMALSPDDLVTFKAITNEDKKFTALAQDTQTILKILNLPQYWLTPMMSIILSNTAFSPKEKDKTISIEYIGGLKKFRQEVNILDKDRLVISFREKLTLKEMKKVLDKNEKDINKFMSYLPKAPDQRSGLKTIKDLDIRKKMLQYKKDGMENKQVGQKIKEEYGERNIGFELEKDQIATYQARFKKMVDDLIKNKYLLSDFLENR